MDKLPNIEPKAAWDSRLGCFVCSLCGHQLSNAGGVHSHFARRHNSSQAASQHEWKLLTDKERRLYGAQYTHFCTRCQELGISYKNEVYCEIVECEGGK